MTQPSSTDVDSIREQAAAEERAAILEIVERAMRQLAHGHGASGAQALQRVADEIQRRNDTHSPMLDR